MAMATVLSRAQHGMDAPQVRVEVDISSGLPAFAIVGLPEAVVKESKDRVRAAIANCNFEIPAGRITVNLSPADLPKEGGRFDLPIAVGILLASGQLPGAQLEQCELLPRQGVSDQRQALGQQTTGGGQHAGAEAVQRIAQTIGAQAAPAVGEQLDRDQEEKEGHGEEDVVHGATESLCL